MPTVKNIIILCFCTCLLNAKYASAIVSNKEGVASPEVGSKGPDTGFCALFEPSATVVISCSKANKPTGSITNIKVIGNGTINYTWYENGVIVSHSEDLLNMGPGKYQLMVTDSSNCGPLYSPVYTIKAAPQFADTSQVIITPSSCDEQKGSITGIKVLPGTLISWQNEFAGGWNTADLTNVPPGVYTITCSNDTSCAQTYGPFVIPAVDGPAVYPANLAITDATCGKSNGSITGLKVVNPAGSTALSWKDETGMEIANTLDLKNVPAGDYELVVGNSEGGSCRVVYGPWTITNNGRTVIDDSNVQIVAANCKNLGGAINGIVVHGSGNQTYEWIQSISNKPVGTNIDLENVQQGNYFLKVTDNCGVTYSKIYYVWQTGLSNLYYAVTKTTCNNLGSVFVEDNEANHYIWRDDTGAIVDTNRNLTNALGGVYIVYHYDDCGDSNTTSIDVGMRLIQLPQFNYQVKNTCPNTNTGWIKMDINSQVSSIRWVDASGQTVGANPEIDNLAAGAYELYLTDVNKCEHLYGTYNVLADPPLTVATNSAKVNDDQCNTGAGSVTGVQVTGGEPPYVYTWTDSFGNTIANTADLMNVKQGVYTLTVTDSTGCQHLSAGFTVSNNDDVLPQPTISGVELCDGSNAILQVTDTIKGNFYRLYTSATAPDPVYQSSNGRFTIPAGNSNIYYLSQVSGECESARTAVAVKFNLSQNDIPNTISPNGDGINDYWNIKELENYPGAEVEVFNRYGQQVFYSKGYARPFDGTSNSKPLTAGVYYYIINLHLPCSLISGYLTIIR